MTMKLDPHDTNAHGNRDDGRGDASTYWNVLYHMSYGEEINEMLTIKLSVAGTNEEIFTYEACTNAFNIDEPIYSNLYHKFYSTYEFDEVCADDELRTKKIIKFRLCGRAFSWTLVEFAKRLGLYHPQEIEEDGFDVYFQGRLRSDKHFNTQEYWLSISQVENISMLMSHASTIWKPFLRVLHKIISYGLCQRTTGYDKMQKTNLWLLSMFEAKHQNRYANVAWLIARWIKRKTVGSQKESAELFECSDYSRALETTMLKELIDSKGRLILEGQPLRHLHTKKPIEANNRLNLNFKKMHAFPRLDELAVAAKSRSLFDVMMIYFKRETMNDLEFAADLHNLYEDDDVGLYVLWFYVHEDDDVRTGKHILWFYLDGDDGKLFQSCGCLLLVCRDDIGSSEFTIYEMMKGCSIWSVTYRVDTDDFMTPLPKGWSIRSTVRHIVLGEREEDSLLVINLSEKVVQYNLIVRRFKTTFFGGS
nr:hypothetical protein [Tanacetum cinerariifolium]